MTLKIKNKVIFDGVFPHGNQIDIDESSWQFEKDKKTGQKEVWIFLTKLKKSTKPPEGFWNSILEGEPSSIGSKIISVNPEDANSTKDAIAKAKQMQMQTQK